MERVELGPFTLRHPIGKGGMGEVWAGVHTDSGVPVAVKVMTVRGARNPDFVGAFRNEVRAAAALDHPNLVMVLDFGTIPAEAQAQSEGALVSGTPYLVMERAERALSRRDPPMAWPVLRQALLGLLDGLAHAHARGVIHRDIKPSNVLVGGLRPGHRLTDFGLAHALERERPLSDRQAVSIGTPSFMAPEQFERRWRDYGPWTDLYSFGCLVHVLCSGRPPFVGDTYLDVMVAHLRDLPPRLVSREPVPDALDEWVGHLLEKDATLRFQRAADAARALRELGKAVVRSHVPVTWKRPEPVKPPIPLVGAGLGLYGLRAVPLVGRLQHRDRLWTALRRAHQEGTTQVVVLRGPAGYGKSRLARWLCERAHEMGVAEVLKAVHSPIPGPRDGLGPMVARELRIDGLHRFEALHRVESRIHDGAVAEALVELASGSLEAADSDLRGRFSSSHERYMAIRRFMGHANLPWVVWLDDVQWGFDGLGLADFLLGEAVPAVILLTAQEETLATRPAESALLARLLERGAQSIEVGPLSEDQRVELIQRLLMLEPDLAKRVAERCAGNPLFGVQLLGDWVQREVLEVGADGFRLRDATRVDIPASLHTVWVTRIERVLAGRPDAEGEALELAAVLGQEVDPVEWTEVCARARIHSSAQLVERLIAWRLARVGVGGGWAFVHGMVRESLVRRAVDAGRAPSHHRACAAMLRGRAGYDVPERLGLHLLEAGEFEAALEPLLDGARRRADTGEYQRQQSLLELRSQAMHRLGLPDADERWGEGWVALASGARHQGDWERAETLAQRAEREARLHWWPSVLGHALLVLGRAAWRASEFERSNALFREARDLLEMVDREGLGHCLLAMSINAQVQGRLDEADTHAREAGEHFVKLGSVRWLADSYRVRGQVAFQRGALEVARRFYLQAAELFEAEGARLSLGICLTGLADVAREDGDLGEARLGYERSLALFEALASPLAAHSRISLAIVKLREERFSEARLALLDVWGDLASRQRTLEMAGVRVFLLVCAAAAHDWTVFDDLVQQATTSLAESGFVDADLGWAAERAAELARDQGEWARARSAYDLALAQWWGLERLAEGRAVLAALNGLPGDEP